MIQEILNFEVLVSFLLYFFIGCVGGIAKYLHTVTTQKLYKMQVRKMAVRALVTAFGMPVVERYWGEQAGIELLILISFVMGVVGFELFGKFSTITNILATLKEARRIRHLDFGDERKNERRDE